jgi:hypothetical protein
MNLPAWLGGVSLALHLAPWQQFGLAFLLGSFAVATWSDLKRMSAQREFVEIWLVFVLAILALDAYHFYQGEAESSAQSAGVKWGLIALLSLLSLRRVGVLFALAPADVAALAAAASLLPPLHVILFYAVAKLLALVLGPALKRDQPVWPFMPVVSLATLAILALGWWW